jgi:hypothetical protein
MASSLVRWREGWLSTGSARISSMLRSNLLTAQGSNAGSHPCGRHHVRLGSWEEKDDASQQAGPLLLEDPRLPLSRAAQSKEHGSDSPRSAPLEKGKRRLYLALLRRLIQIVRSSSLLTVSSHPGRCEKLGRSCTLVNLVLYFYTILSSVGRNRQADRMAIGKTDGWKRNQQTARTSVLPRTTSAEATS